MSKYIIKCNTCKTILSNELTKLSFSEFNKIADLTIHNDYKSHELLPEGFLYINTAEIESINYVSERDIIVNLKDIKNTRHHYDSSRLNGCCGLSGFNGINTLCSKNHEIGIEESDCLTPSFFHFDSYNVYLYQLNNDLKQLMSILKTSLNDETKESINNLIENELEKDAFLFLVDNIYMQQIKLAESTILLFQNLAQHLNISSNEWDMLKELI